MTPLVPLFLDRPRLMMRHWCLLCIGDWLHGGSHQLQFFAYRATHPAAEQRDAYAKSVETTGLRFHAQGPDWFEDPNSIAVAAGDNMPNPYHRVLLEKHFGESSIYELTSRWGNPWAELREGVTHQPSKQNRLAALIIWFMGQSIPDFEFTALEQVNLNEVRARIPGLRDHNREDYCINGWSKMGLPYVFGVGTFFHQFFMLPAPPPAAGLYILDHARATHYGMVAGGFPVVARVPVPLRHGPNHFDQWAVRANEAIKRLMPNRLVVLAGERGFFRTTQDAVLFRLAVDAE
jgi:hypothetical protein